MVSLMTLMPRTTVRIANVGRSAQNSTPGVRSTPGNCASGMPTHGASITRCRSYIPNAAASAQPTPMLMNADQSRHAPEARNASTVEATSVASATAGAAPAGAPSGTSAIRANATGTTVTAMSISTVPETTGVMSRRSNGSQAASANWKIEETSIRLAMSAGPPSEIAAAVTTTNWMVGPVITTSPAPILANWFACSAVMIALMISAANTAHVR